MRIFLDVDFQQLIINQEPIRPLKKYPGFENCNALGLLSILRFSIQTHNYAKYKKNSILLYFESYIYDIYIIVIEIMPFGKELRKKV